MTNTSRLLRALCTLVLFGVPVLSRAQSPDTVTTDTTAERLGLWARTSRGSGLIISSAKTYNRVEGLPVYIGPSFHDSVAAAEINVSVLGIIRSADTFHWDDENIGHRVMADMRVGRGRGYGLGISSYDVVTPVEQWTTRPRRGTGGVLRSPRFPRLLQPTWCKGNRDVQHESSQQLLGGLERRALGLG